MTTFFSNIIIFYYFISLGNYLFLDRIIMEFHLLEGWRDIRRMERYYKDGGILEGRRDIRRMERYYKDGGILKGWRDIRGMK